MALDVTRRINMKTDYAPSLDRASLSFARSLSISFLLFAPLLLIGCPGRANKTDNANLVTLTASSTPAPAYSGFDGERAFEHVRKQVEFGPRPPGSPELEKTRNYIIDQLKSYGLRVMTDEFHSVTPVGDRKM